MDLGRRVRGIEKRLGMRKPEELSIDLVGGKPFKVSRDRWEKLLEKIARAGLEPPPCELANRGPNHIEELA